MSKRERKKANQVKVDLTPMIDVVFQLIIFFILTMTITNQNLKDVVLPTALAAPDEDTADAESEYMLHLWNPQAVRQDSIPPVEAWEITTPDQVARLGQSGAPLKTVDDIAAQLAAKVRSYGKREEADARFSGLTVLVRGDMRAPSHFFAVILEACIKESVMIRNVRISIAPPPDRLRDWEKGQAR